MLDAGTIGRNGACSAGLPMSASPHCAGTLASGAVRPTCRGGQTPRRSGWSDPQPRPEWWHERAAGPPAAGRERGAPRHRHDLQRAVRPGLAGHRPGHRAQPGRRPGRRLGRARRRRTRGAGRRRRRRPGRAAGRRAWRAGPAGRHRRGHPPGADPARRGRGHAVGGDRADRARRRAGRVPADRDQGRGRPGRGHPADGDRARGDDLRDRARPGQGGGRGGRAGPARAVRRAAAARRPRRRGLRQLGPPPRHQAGPAAPGHDHRLPDRRPRLTGRAGLSPGTGRTRRPGFVRGDGTAGRGRAGTGGGDRRRGGAGAAHPLPRGHRRQPGQRGGRGGGRGRPVTPTAGAGGRAVQDHGRGPLPGHRGLHRHRQPVQPGRPASAPRTRRRGTRSTPPR